jgi:hypothetical protein
MTRFQHLRLPALIALVTLASVRCSEPPADPEASSIEPVDGNNQTGLVGQALPEPLVILITDESGNPVANVSVSWSVQGGGTVSASSVTTGADGRASVQRTLGPTVGQQTTTASATGLDGSPVTFTATAIEEAPASLVVDQQPSGTAQSGVLFAVQPIIQLQDADGDDLAEEGLEVTASIASGTGTLGGDNVRTTDATGKATFTDLMITGPAGTYTVLFTAPGTNQVLSAPITISAAVNGIAITTNPPVSALTSEVFSPVAQPVVRVTDAAGNPVAGAEVTASIASGSGAVEGDATIATGTDGVATFVDLGIRGTGEHTLAFTTGTASVTSSPVSISPLPPEAGSGKWGPIVPWDIVPLHLSLLPNGKIFAWGRAEASVTDTMGMPRIWDPATQASPIGLPEIHVEDMLFCAGHTLMPDGRLMVAGGHYKDAAGIKVTYFFDQNGAPISAPSMAHGRWYPTLTVLSDGRVVTMAGRNQAGAVVRTPEIWENNQWVELPGAGNLEIPYYPRNFVDPKNGLLFYAGERVQSRWFNPDASGASGRGSWTSGPSHIYGFNRDYGSAVMYDAGKVLVVGGGGHTGWSSPDPKAATPTATAEIIDLNQTAPAWRSTGSMAFRRRHMNATILPDGQVLATGGTTGGGFVNINEGLAAKAAEIWNPATGDWTTLAANQVMRTYHSVSMLLPDGTVLHGASGDALIGDGVTPMPREKNHEIFSPPYLFKGARPSITSAPASVGYGQTFSVATPHAAQITDARWIRLGSVTHAFDMSQRANTLAFTRTPTGVDITAPMSPNLVPPGHYLLFILNRNGVPSAGRVVLVQ